MNEQELNKLKEDSSKSDWEKYEQEDVDPAIMSEFEQKHELLKSKVKLNINEPEDILTAAMSLSYIDLEGAYIYAQKASALEEWRLLGFPHLAKQRLVHLLIRLSLFRSVDGFERVLQTSDSSAHMEISRRSGVKISPQQEDEDGFGGKFKNLLSDMRERQRNKIGR